MSDPCENAYDLHSELYGNIYKWGLKRQGCLIATPVPIFPDKYRYFDFCINPNNEYEICYLRINHVLKIIVIILP